jgi:hypothetical protein
MNSWTHRLFKVRGKQGRQQCGGQIDVVRFDCGGPGLCFYGRDFNGAKPALADLADGRYRTLRLRRSDQQEDGI